MEMRGERVLKKGKHSKSLNYVVCYKVGHPWEEK